MKTRAVKFVVAIAALILSSANLLAAPESAEQPGDKCLTSPGEKTPAGGHWRYRLERGTGRQCWYLKGDTEKSARKAPEETAAAAEEPAAAPARKKPPATPALSDARAEFSRTAVEPESKPAQAQRSPFPTPATTAANQPASPEKANVMAPGAAMRWPDPTSTANPGVRAPAPATKPTEDVRPAQTAAAPAPPQVMPRAVPPAPASEKPLSLPMLITIVAGGLSVVGVILSMLFGWRASRGLTPTAPMPPLEESGDQPRRPGDLYRDRQRMRTGPTRRRAA